MAKRYAIWNKQDMIYTPSGAVFTPEEWVSNYRILEHPQAIPVISAGLINGAFCGELSQMLSLFPDVDFSIYETDEEKLERYEQEEDELNKPSNVPTTDERIASALEAQVMLNMPDMGVAE